MKTLLKILIVIAVLGFVGNLLNEKVNVPLIAFIFILGVALVLLEHYKPLDMKKKHKEVIILVVYNIVSNEMNTKDIPKLIDQLMKILKYRNSIGFTTADTCGMLIEDSDLKFKVFSEFDEHQIEYFQQTLNELMKFKLFPEQVTISKVNDYLKRISTIQID